MKYTDIIITGSLAYDHIMTFDGSFADHILEDHLEKLNVAFGIEDMRIDFGGTAGNIAYGLSLLGQTPKIHATIGSDHKRYFKHLEKMNLNTSGVHVIEEDKTAQAFITTDTNDNQITAFYAGAMRRAFEHKLDLRGGELVIISPNQKTAMLKHAIYCREHHINFIVDPGQAMTLFTGKELLEMTSGSLMLIVNEYEWNLFKEKTGKSEKEVLELTQNILITKGEEGVELHNKTGVIAQGIYHVKAVDPTGAGDAFRSGLLYAMHEGKDQKEQLHIASAVASFCVEKQGTQNHHFDYHDVEKRLSFFS